MIGIHIRSHLLAAHVSYPSIHGFVHNEIPQNPLVNTDNNAVFNKYSTNI